MTTIVLLISFEHMSIEVFLGFPSKPRRPAELSITVLIHWFEIIITLYYSITHKINNKGKKICKHPAAKAKRKESIYSIMINKNRTKINKSKIFRKEPALACSNSVIALKISMISSREKQNY